MKWVFTLLIVAGVIFGGVTGNIEAVSNAALAGGQDAVNLCLKLTAALCLWSGMLKIAEAAGITEGIAKILSPLLRRIFPSIRKEEPAFSYIAMNVTANLLGLGNAATPFGLKAAAELQSRPKELCYFVVLNTASVQLLPTTVASLRALQGSGRPLDILPAVWVSSGCALVSALTMAWLLYRRKQI